jgi:uncharacterized membrane protein YfcA
MRDQLLKLETFAVGTIAVFSALFLLQTYEYGRRAALFPKLVSFTILFLTGCFLVSRLRRAIKRQRTEVKKKETIPVEVESEATQPAGVHWLLTLSAATGFFVLIYLVGFGPATFFYVATHLSLAGYRRHSVIALFALAMAIIIVGTGYLFTIPLPEGVLVEMIAGER